MVQKLWQRLNFLEIVVKGHSEGYKVTNLGSIWKGFIC